jgi:hypothetical protein
MYDILDTLDALLKEKNFYPSVDRYSAELKAAGIFVQRMEVAMSAVMHKTAKQMSFDQFTSLYRAHLAQLPEDQRANIAKYYTGSSSPSGLRPSKLVAQYLQWAKDAVYKTRSLLDRGALNRGSDFFSGGVYATIKARNKEGGRNYWTPEDLAEIAIDARGGNCQEFSATAYVQLKKMGARPIHWVTLVNGDHAFVLIGNGPFGMMDDNDLKRWGDSVVVCDAWDRVSYVASEIPRRLPSYKGTFKAMIQHGIGF